MPKDTIGFEQALKDAEFANLLRSNRIDRLTELFMAQRDGFLVWFHEQSAATKETIRTQMIAYVQAAQARVSRKPILTKGEAGVPSAVAVLVLVVTLGLEPVKDFMAQVRQQPSPPDSTPLVVPASSVGLGSVATLAPDTVLSDQAPTVISDLVPLAPATEPNLVLPSLEVAPALPSAPASLVPMVLDEPVVVAATTEISPELEQTPLVVPDHLQKAWEAYADWNLTVETPTQTLLNQLEIYHQCGVAVAADRPLVNMLQRQLASHRFGTKVDGYWGGQTTAHFLAAVETGLLPPENFCANLDIYQEATTEFLPALKQHLNQTFAFSLPIDARFDDATQEALILALDAETTPLTFTSSLIFVLSEIAHDQTPQAEAAAATVAAQVKVIVAAPESLPAPVLSFGAQFAPRADQLACYAGSLDLQEFDATCLARGVNPNQFLPTQRLAFANAGQTPTQAALALMALSPAEIEAAFPVAATPAEFLQPVDTAGIMTQAPEPLAMQLVVEAVQTGLPSAVDRAVAPVSETVESGSDGAELVVQRDGRVISLQVSIDVLLSQLSLLREGEAYGITVSGVLQLEGNNVETYIAVLNDEGLDGSARYGNAAYVLIKYQDNFVLGTVNSDGRINSTLQRISVEDL